MLSKQLSMSQTGCSRQLYLFQREFSISKLINRLTQHVWQAAQALKDQAEAALEDLKATVEKSTSVLDTVEPTSPEAFAADQAVASAAAKAQKLTKALNEYKRTGLLKGTES